MNIGTDIEGKKKAEALAQLLQKIEQEEEQSWGSQFVTACMLHPTKSEEGDIVDVSAMEGFMHFLCIGWKLLFSFVPPPHYAGGWACFIVALFFIGIVTFVVGEFANLLEDGVYNGWKEGDVQFDLLQIEKTLQNAKKDKALSESDLTIIREFGEDTIHKINKIFFD